jgi:hypothetical protein
MKKNNNNNKDLQIRLENLDVSWHVLSLLTRRDLCMMTMNILRRDWEIFNVTYLEPQG